MEKKNIKDRTQLWDVKNTRMIIALFCMLFCVSCISSQVRKMKNHMDKEFIAKVGAVYEETPDDNPCAGSEIYLILLFDKKQVHVAEKEMSSCDKETIQEIGTFDWKLKDNKEIAIDFIPQKIQGTYAENLILELRDKQLVGRIKHLNGQVKEYIFKEKN
ncbi:hypothetical protein [uncultured Aquimarina sp.]|uniref:hypothetical protein n=1 Tax=uncultured Aquimarina sp. TaxID=575652 RepID=UPI00260868F5|nr:hypothetical protein [uncultured Aquimarina sp.]